MILIYTFLGSVFSALVFTPMVLGLAGRYGVVDIPNARGVHTRPVSHIGGVSIFISTMLVTIIAAYVYMHTTGLPDWGQMTALLLAGTFIFVIGFWDDVVNIRAIFKLAAQISAGLVVCLAGVRFSSINIRNVASFEMGWLGWPVSLLWIVAITNAVNLSDGLDGLAAGVSLIACAVIVSCVIGSGFTTIIILILAMMGSLGGFLFFNFHPAKIFMGDGGSQFIGFMIASVSLICLSRTGGMLVPATVIIALGVPIWDMGLAVVRRISERRSVFAPDRSHIHHRLIDMDFKQGQAVMLIYLVTSIATGLGMFMRVTGVTGSVVIYLCIQFIFLLFFRLVGAFSARELLTNLTQRYRTEREIKQEKECFEKAQLLFRRAESFEQWWKALCVTAANMRVNSFTLSFNERDLKPSIHWHGENGYWRRSRDRLEVSIPIFGNRFDLPAKLRLVICKNGSLESAGRKITLIARLMDQYGFDGLMREKERTQDHLTDSIPRDTLGSEANDAEFDSVSMRRPRQDKDVVVLSYETTR